MLLSLPSISSPTAVTEDMKTALADDIIARTAVLAFLSADD
jgi:hypothetical protein